MSTYVTIMPHAYEAMFERGAQESEVIAAIERGEMVPAKKNVFMYIRNFHFDEVWRDKYYTTKQVLAIVAHHGDERRVVTVITKYFGSKE